MTTFGLHKVFWTYSKQQPSPHELSLSLVPWEHQGWSPGQQPAPCFRSQQVPSFYAGENALTLWVCPADGALQQRQKRGRNAVSVMLRTQALGPERYAWVSTNSRRDVTSLSLNVSSSSEDSQGAFGVKVRGAHAKPALGTTPLVYRAIGVQGDAAAMVMPLMTWAASFLSTPPTAGHLLPLLSGRWVGHGRGFAGGWGGGCCYS